MVKKIILIGLFSLFVIGGVSANNNLSSDIKGGESDLQAENEINIEINSDDLMTDFDRVVGNIKIEKEKKIKNNCICTLEYAPVCGEVNGKKITFGNKCEFNCRARNERIKFLYNGGCQEQDYKKKQIKHNFLTEVDQDGWVRVDNQFWFNVKTKEWKDSFGICHTCTEENGFTQNGEILTTKLIHDTTKSVIHNIKSANSGDDFVDRFKVKIFDEGGGANGLWENKDFKKISFGSKMLVFQGKEKLEIKNGSLFIGSKEVKIDPEKAEEKAKNSASADIVLSSKIEEENMGVNYVVETKKKGKFLGIFDFGYTVEVKVDINTGVVVEIDEPWYSFLIF